MDYCETEAQKQQSVWPRRHTGGSASSSSSVTFGNDTAALSSVFVTMLAAWLLIRPPCWTETDWTISTTFTSLLTFPLEFYHGSPRTTYEKKLANKLKRHPKPHQFPEAWTTKQVQHVPGYVTAMVIHEEEPETRAAETPWPSSSERKAVVSDQVRRNLRPSWLTASFDCPTWPTGPTWGGWCWLMSSQRVRKWIGSGVCGVFWQIKALKKAEPPPWINMSMKVIQVRCCIVENWTLM